MTEAITSIEDVAAAASSLFKLKGEAEAALELRLSLDDVRNIRDGKLDALDDPTVIPRLKAWTAEHIDDIFELRDQPLPTFDHTREFWWNFDAGPRIKSIAARRRAVLTAPPELTLFGRPLRFPFGVPSCALTVNSDWVSAFAKAGFDVITYKTVRDRPWNAHEFPQWGIVTEPVELRSDAFDVPVTATVDPSSVQSGTVALANSFGVPSLHPDEWMPDVTRARGSLDEGQTLIVSVMGTPESADGIFELAQQFARAADFAVKAGAHAIEANLSCPNTGGEVPLSSSPEQSRVVLAAIREALGIDVPLIAKIGYLPAEQLRAFFLGTHDLVDGFTAINTIGVPVVDRAGDQYFPGATRKKAGISGTPIHRLALEVVHGLSALRTEVGRVDELVIIGVGGVTNTETFSNLLREGADVVQSCSGAWADPNLASRIQSEMTTDSTHRSESAWDVEAPFDTQLSLLAALPPRTPLSVYDVAAVSLLSPKEIASAVASAERSGWIDKSGDEVTITDKGRRMRRSARRTPPLRSSGAHVEDERSIDERFEAVYRRLENSI